MASYDILVLVILVPTLWWLMAMVRAVLNVRARDVAMTKLDPSMDEAYPYR